MSHRDYYHTMPRYHEKCKNILDEKIIPVSFTPTPFLVDYCPKCKVYIYQWGKDDKIGIESGDINKARKYIEDSQKIIRKIHFKNIEKMKIL